MTTMRRRSAGAADPAQPSALDELLATERDIAAREMAAAREAQALVGAAIADNEANEREAAVALGRELEDLDRQARATEAAAVSALEREAADRAVRYRSLSADEIARLATFVCDRVTGLSVTASP
jgi:hypothetical protein